MPVSEEMFIQRYRDLFWRFVHERQMIYMRRVVLKKQKPWTRDPILQNEFITNIYRELDPGTQYIINTVLNDSRYSEGDRAFHCFSYRLMGSQAPIHDQVRHLLKTSTFDPEALAAELRGLRDAGEKVFGDAYRVSSYSAIGGNDKIGAVVMLLHEAAEDWPSIWEELRECASMQLAFEILNSIRGLGPFLAWQVLVDLTYEDAEGKQLVPHSQDSWAMAGPGARKGIERMLKTRRSGIKPASALEIMRWLRDNQQQEFKRLDLDFPCIIDKNGIAVPLTLANIQSCLCEYAKYIRIYDGGVGVRLYPSPEGEQEVTGPSVFLDLGDPDPVEMMKEEMAYIGGQTFEQNERLIWPEPAKAADLPAPSGAVQEAMEQMAYYNQLFRHPPQEAVEALQAPPEAPEQPTLYDALEEAEEERKTVEVPARILDPGAVIRKYNKRPTRTSSFGTSRRINHDSAPFYRRFDPPPVENSEDVRWADAKDMFNSLVLADSSNMEELPDNCVALVVTSPPYFAGKEYEKELEGGNQPESYFAYLEALKSVMEECYRVLEPGGRLALNLANLGRKPFRSLVKDGWTILEEIGYLPRGEHVWLKADGASGSCAWGTFGSARNPVMRDLSERILVACKQRFDRAIKPSKRSEMGLPWADTITKDQFMEATLDVWKINPAQAKKIGHPAPFPIELPRRLIQLHTFEGDLVLDPYVGSGTTCIAAAASGRHAVGYDIEAPYLGLARKRIQEETGTIFQAIKRENE